MKLKGGIGTKTGLTRGRPDGRQLKKYMREALEADERRAQAERTTRTLDDMSPEEKAALEAKYGAKIAPRRST